MTFGTRNPYLRATGHSAGRGGRNEQRKARTMLRARHVDLSLHCRSCRVIEINLRGTFLTCQAAARSMVAGKRAGKIITISSGAHASARPGGAPYCASKAGVVMFTKTLAMELAEARINVNCIAPGYIQSEGAVSNSDFQRALLSNILWGRFGTPADVAQMTLFLASSAADYVTGEVFAVNGGAFAGRMYLPLDTATAR